MKILFSTSFVLPFIMVLFFFHPHHAYSAESGSEAFERFKEKRLEKEERELKKKEQCVSRKNEQTAALVAEDWESLMRIAKSYVTNCKGIFDHENIYTEWLSDAHENIVIANNRLGKFKDALVASEACTKAYYDHPGCYVAKAEALIALGRRTEAVKSLDIAERLTLHASERARWDLDHARSELDKEVHTAYISRCGSYIDSIYSMRIELDR